MKILCVSLGRNGTQSFTEFMEKQGLRATHFYDFEKIPYGAFTEDADGIENHFNTLPYADAHVDIPTCLIFDRLYKRFPDAKFINITRPAEDWVASMIKMRRLMGHEHEPYIFEEAYCNFYAKTGKTKIQDLDEQELLAIREAHLDKINYFFKDKDNYLEVELTDPDISGKIARFIGKNPNIPFPSKDTFRAYP
jgi:hypothetical protein